MGGQAVSFLKTAQWESLRERSLLLPPPSHSLYFPRAQKLEI